MVTILHHKQSNSAISQVNKNKTWLIAQYVSTPALAASWIAKQSNPQNYKIA